MGVQSACQVPEYQVPEYQVPAPRVLAKESLGRPNCPRCGRVLLVAEQSRFDANAANAANAMGRIDHHWFCDDCGNAFVTSIRLCPC